MELARTLPFLPRNPQQNQVINDIASTATSMLRQMAIKPYSGKIGKREMLLRATIPTPAVIRNEIFVEKGKGKMPTIVVGGFVPDATEAVEFQRELFKSYGSIYYINYARNGFFAPMFFAQLADLIEDLNTRGEKPVIFSISFGCGLVRAFLESSDYSNDLNIGGVVMTSPVLCSEDLIRPDAEASGVRMLESNLKRIFKADASNTTEVNQRIERARKCFQALFESGATNRSLTWRHLSIRKKIMDVVATTPARGGYERVLALKDFKKLAADRPLFCGPALTLFAELEHNILSCASPTLSVLAEPTSRQTIFPLGKVKTVTSPERSDSVNHASLIFHHHCYNPHIESWYEKLRKPVLFAFV